MKKIAYTLAIVSMFILALSHTTQAQESNTYVAVGGNDANNCSREAPCRTFSGAIDKTAVGGEITALDTGEYGGSIKINKSLTIAGAPGVLAAIGEANTWDDPVSVNIVPSDVVVLRNLRISRINTYPPIRTPFFGVFLQGAGTVYVEGCIIQGWGGDGISVQVGGPSPRLLRLFVSDTTISDCQQSGIYLNALSYGSLEVSLEHCRLYNNGAGLFSDSNLYPISVSSEIKTTVRDTVASGNGFAFRNRYGQMNIANCEASNNQGSILNEYGTVRVSGSVVTNNWFGFQNRSGTFESLGNNLVRGNSNVGTITIVPGT